MNRSLSFLLAVLVAAAPLAAQRGTAPDRTGTMLKALDSRAPHYAEIAKQIWSFAELGYQETKSSALLAGELEQAGFTVRRGVAGEPTAFIAEYGSGKPVIGIMGEFDALPGLSQEASPTQKAVAVGGAGHGCGHNLFGTASAAAAISVKEWMIANKVQGLLRFYGTPAEEGGAGKVYMVRDGLFNDVDVVVVWHPGDRNGVAGSSTLANISGKFRFHGISAHAAAAPERGRSALDAVEIMDVAVNFMREHIPQDTRIHYVITNGGRAPNVVPDFAEVYYVARQNDMRILQDIWERVQNAAKGAALATGTTYELEVTGAVYNVLPNEVLARVQQKNLERVGGFAYTPEERAFAEKLQQTYLPGTIVPLEMTTKVEPLHMGGFQSASSDVGDVSWVVPTTELSAATWVPGTPAHSWQAVAAGGMSIGAKGMMVAAKAMALTVGDLFLDPATIASAKAELAERRGKDFAYKSALADRKPALDYRK